MSVFEVRVVVAIGLAAGAWSPADEPVRLRSDAEPIASSWDDLTDGVATLEDWERRRVLLRRRYLYLLRDDRKPIRPPLAMEIHESIEVDDVYTRHWISYAVESDERAHAFLAVPKGLAGKTPGVVVLPPTNPQGVEEAAGLAGAPEKAFLDGLARRGYVVVSPEHFVAGRRTPPEGAFETGRFYQKHPNWTAAGKFPYEHSIAIDVLQTRQEVDGQRIGAMGHSLGGHGAFFLAAYDERVRAAASNCSAAFFRQNAGVEHWARDRWYVYFQHIRPDLLDGRLPPIDFHEIIALVAPRAFLDVMALNNGNRLTQRQRVLMLTKIMDVYELYEKPENFAFFVHGKGHSAPDESRALLYAWLDGHLNP